MLKFQERRVLHKLLYSRYFLVFMCIPLGGMTYAAYNAYEVERKSYERKILVQEEVSLLKAQASVLEADIARLEDPFGVEAELRKRYEVGRAGEEAIVLVVDKAPEIADEPVLQEEPPVRFLDKVRALF